MEQLIHTPEGELKIKDPLREVGTRGFYRIDPSYRWVITKESIEASNYEADAITVVWLSMVTPKLYKTYNWGPSTKRISKREYMIIKPEDSDYFKIEGID